MRTILLVDDDEDLREALAESLVMTDEFEVLEASSAQEGIEKARNSRFDMAILDVGLPDMDGRELCKKLRREGCQKPILMLTGHTGDSDEVLGLESGANDYILKPFKMPKLLARIRSHFRQFEQSDDVSFGVGQAFFEPGKKQFVKPDGQAVRLTEKEVGVLKYLCRSKERHAAREELLDNVWGYSEGVSTHTLETHIYRLRQKIEEEPAKPAYLVTHQGGYALAEPA